MKLNISYILVNITLKLRYYIRFACRLLPPQARIITVLTLFILFAIFNLYITGQGIYSIFYKESKENIMNIKHIEPLELSRNDSINILNQKKYEYKQTDR